MAKVAARSLLPLIEELVVAVGSKREAARRIGITETALYYILSGRTLGVRQATAAAILLAAWPYSLRARTRSAHGLFDSKDCAFGSCAMEATEGEFCRAHAPAVVRAA